MASLEVLRDIWRSLSRRKKLVILALAACYLKYMYKRLTRPSFKEKIVLVTGGAMGIGKLMCQKLKAQGAVVVIWDINKTALAEMERNGFHTYLVDVTSRAAVFETQQKVKNDVGVVEVLINNAGIVKGKSILELTEKEIRLTMDVNAISHFWTCQAFLPDMMKLDYGHIVTISSLAGFDGMCGFTDYCASKFACRGFAESLRRELVNTNVKSTIVHPFVINTGMFHGTNTPKGLWKIFSSLLEPDYAAQEILNGTAMGQIRVVLPLRGYILPVIGEMMPWWMRDILAKKSFGLKEGGIKDPRKNAIES